MPYVIRSVPLESFVVRVIAFWLITSSVVLANEVPLGGFIPFVGIGLTDEFKHADTDVTGTYFLADAEPSYVGTALTGNASPFFDLALLDTGAATHILTSHASGSEGFDIDGNDFDGTNFQQIGGATGLINLKINDPLGIFAAGLGDRGASGPTLAMNTSAMRGQSSVATLSAPNEWKLPNILGLPMAAHHAIRIQNSDPQIFEHQGRTVRTPQVDFIELGTGDEQGIIRRTELSIRPGASFIAGPLYIQNIDIFGGEPFHENPLSPTIVESGALFVDVDLRNGEKSLDDKELLFDTGADLTVVSEQTAVRLGFDPVLDTPDFILEVEGSGGVAGGVPGFYLEELNLDTVGGSFTAHHVPIAVLDVTNPNDPGNTIDGIIGMHLFTGRDLVIDANPSIGQGGAGPSLYISDPVTETHVWNSTVAQTNFALPGNWSAAGTPGAMWVAELRNTAIPQQFVSTSSDSTVHRLIVAGDANSEMRLQIRADDTITTYGETRVDTGGEIVLLDGKLDAQFVNLAGGTLSGSGEVFVGTGPIHGAVRNLSGRIDPTGTLSIVGDLSNLAEGIIEFNLGELGSDHIDVERFAFLAGTLEVDLGGSFAPSIGQMFTLITADEGVVGDFDLLFLPAGYFWDVDYQANHVVLEVTGIGDLEGDFDRDGDVDLADLTMWERAFGQPGGYDGHDFLAWQRSLGTSALLSAAATVPEPGAGWLLLMAIAWAGYQRQKLIA